MTLEKHGLRVVFEENTGVAEFSVPALGICFRQKPSSERVSRVQSDGQKIRFCADVAGLTLDCVYEIKEDETGAYVALTLDAEADFEGMARYPAPIAVQAGDVEIDAYGEGFAFAVEEDLLFPEERLLFGGSHNTMSFWTVARKDGWLMTAVITNANCYLITKKDENGLFVTQVQWQDSKGKWSYPRELRFYLGKGEPIADSALTYRKVARQKGLLKTFAEKAKEVENVLRLAGKANVWLWNNDAMHKLYSSDPEYVPTTKEQYETRCRVAQEMKALGMTDVLWSMFDENVDRDEVEYVKELGFLTTYYDVYTDVIPQTLAPKLTGTRRKRCEHRMKYWPDGVLRQKDGTAFPAWALKGVDGAMYEQDRMCDRVACQCAEEHVQSHGVENGIEGVFVDVSFGCTLECYDERHPQTRKEGIEAKNAMLGMMRGKGLFCGAENPHEDCIPWCDYSEGTLSFTMCRLPDAGRRMATVYGLEETTEEFRKYMLDHTHRVPLFELVYHDCHVAYWYWGDSTNSVPALMKRRNLFEILYALPPLYSFSVDTWEERKEEIAASYRRAATAKPLFGVPMVAFTYLSEDKSVQKTTFADGTEILVNFGNVAFEQDGLRLEAGDCKILA